MKNLRNLMAGFILAVTLIIGAGTANAGILLSDLSGNEPQPCTENPNDTKTDWGIIVQGFTGVIVQGFTGIIVQGAIDTPVNCGILLSD